MKVLIAMDSFKGSMSSLEAGEAARRGVLRTGPAQVVVLPAADGGEGTVEALITGLGGSFRTVAAAGPMGAPTPARYGILPDGRTAVLEIAQAAGLTLVPPEDRDPLRANTAGVGQMILDAVQAGCREFLIGLGGSATTECGLGMLSVLGWDFLDESGRPLPPVFSSLERVARISAARVPPVLRACRFRAACDVRNPLCGPEGAVAIFGPQKGVKPEQTAPMDRALRRFAAAAEAFTGRACAGVPGAGAAGGLGFALLCFLEAELRPGVELVLEAVGFPAAARQADLVLTGEGRLDGQTALGKVPAGVARQARQCGCRVLAFAGSITEDARACEDAGIDAWFPIVRGVTTLETAMEPETARHNLELAVEQAFRLLRLCPEYR